MTVIVVGAGIAGLACARELVDAGITARVIERSRDVGGRLASVREDDRWADVGAAYVTADDPAFLGRLQTWRIDGLAHPWTDTFAAQHGAAPMRWSAPGGLRSLATDLARELDITLGTPVASLPTGADAVVLAMPGPQAAAIHNFAAAADQTWSPVFTAVLTYERRTWGDFHGLFVNDDPVLSTVCDDGSRRGDAAPVLVAHSTPAFATSFLSRTPLDPGPDGLIRPRGERPAAGGLALAEAVSARLDVPDPARIDLFYWPHAIPAAPGDQSFARSGNVYLCGDAFGRPRVQTAWLSGRAAARDILARLAVSGASPRTAGVRAG